MDWTFVLVLVLGVTYSQGSLDQAYTPNREYVYAYEAQLASGMPEGSKLYSGLKVRTDIRFQFKTSSRVTMKMENIHLYKLNDIVDGEDPTREQVSVYKDLTGPEADWMGKYLMKPISFKYVRGHISEIKSESDEYHWSLNVKLGALSMLEMNLEERRSVKSDQKYKNRYSPSEFYTVMEPGVVGDCETTYRLESAVEEGFMYLTKVRNYKNCLERPFYMRTVLNAMRCAQCEKDMAEPFKAGSQIRYYIKGDKSRFMIYSAIAESQHIFTPYSDQGGHVTTFINQTFVLINQDSIKSILAEPSNPKTLPKGLQAIQQGTKDKPWKPLTQSQPLARDPSPERTDEETTQVITEIIGMYYENTKGDQVKPRSTALSFALMDQLRLASPSILRSVWEQFDIKEEPREDNDDRMKYYKRKILIDFLPMTGTPAAFEVFSEYIRKNKLTPYEAALALNSFTITALPDINIAKHLLELVQDTYVMNTAPVRQSAYLCLGAVADRIRNEKDRVIKELRETEKRIKDISAREHRRPVLEQLKSKLVDVRDKQEQIARVFSTLKQEILKEVRVLFKSQKPEYYILGFKTIGNTGFPEFLSDCKSVIEDGSKPQTLRSQAIYSLRKMTEYAPEDVRTVLWPYFFNPQEPEEVRIASYLMIISTNPQRPMLEQISQSLFREYNPHVGSFVYSHLEQLSNSTHPCLMSWAKNATFALRFAKQFTPSFKYSRFFHLSKYYDNLKMGGALEAGYVTSPEEFLPRSGAVHGNMFIMGYSTNVMEIGFNTEGLHKLASRLIGPRSKLAKGMSVLKLNDEQNRPAEKEEQKSDDRRQSQPDIVKGVHDQIKVDPRRSSDPYGHMYVKLFNNEIQYFEFDESLLKKVMEKGQLDLSLSRQDLKAGQDITFYRSNMFLQEYYSWFTELGFPISFKFKGSATNKLTGNWKFDYRPSNNIYEAKFDIKPSFAFELRGIMEADFYYFKSGVGVISKIQSGSPLSFAVTADIHARKYYTEFDFNNLNEHFLKSDIRPTFYVERHFMDITKERSTDSKYLDMMDGGRSMPVSFEFGNNELGLKFGVTGQIAYRDFYRQLPYYPFYGRNTLYFSISPGTNTPQSGEFLFQYFPEASSDLRDNLQRKEQEEDSNRSKRGLLGSLLSYFSKDSDDSSELQLEKRPPKNIDSPPSQGKPVGIERSKSSLSSGKFVFKFTGVGCSPERWYHFEGFYNMKGERNYDFGFKYMRTPYTEGERSQYNVEMKGSFSYPGLDVEPSKLLDLAYQREIRKLLKLYPKQDGEKETDEKELALESQRSKRQDLLQLLDHKQTSKNIKRVIEELVQDLRKNPDASIQELIKLVIKQKKISKQVRKMLKQRHSPLDAQRKLLRIKDLVIELSDVSDSLSRMPEPRDLRKEILIKYLVLKQQVNHQRIEKVAKFLKGNLDQPQQEELATSESRVQRKVQELLQRQSETEPVASARPQLVQELQRQQIIVIKKLDNLPVKEIITVIEQLIKKSDDLLKSIDQNIKEEPEEQANQILSIVIQNQQILTQLQQEVDDQPNIRNAEKGPKGSEIVRLVKRLKEQSRAIVLVIQIKRDEKEIDSVPKSDPKIKIEALKKLNKLRLEQVIIALSIPEAPPMQKDRVKDVLQKLVSVSEKIAEEAEQIQKYSPVLLKLKSIAERQNELLERLRKAVRSDMLSRDQVEKARISNLEVTNSLIKQVKQNLEKHSVRGKAEVGRLVRQIQQHLRSIESMERIQKEEARRNVKPLIDISLKTLKKIKEVIGIVLDQPRPAEYSEELQQVKNLVERQDETLQRIERESRRGSPSEREYISMVNRQRLVLRDVRQEIGERLKEDPKDRPIGQMSESDMSSAIQPNADSYMKLHMDVTFGYKGLRSKMFYIQLVGKKSLEQLQWEARQIFPRKDELVERYVEEIDDPSSKSKPTYRELRPELNFYRHYHFKIKYQKDDFDPYYRMMLWRFQEFFKYNWYPHAEFEMPKESSDNFDLQFDLRKNNRQMDITVSTPLEWYKFYDLYFPWMYYFDFFYGADQVQIPRSVKESSQGLPLPRRLNGECEVRDRSVRTFDGHVLELPEYKKCDAIVAMDCTPSARFLVKVKNIQDQPKRKVISLVIQNRKIEVIEDVKPIVKVDDQPQDLVQDRPVVIPRAKAESSDKRPLVEISKQDKIVLIRVPSEDIQIVASEEKVQVMATPLHTSRLCGLCGNYDGIRHNDKENPAKLQHKSASCLLVDYIRPSPQCDLKPIQDQCEREQPKSPEDCKPQERTQLKTRVSKDKNQLCFSVEPVKKCKPGCKEVKPKGKRIPMKCINQDERRAKILQSQSHHRPLPEIASLVVPKDDLIQSYVEEPYSCRNP